MSQLVKSEEIEIDQFEPKNYTEANNLARFLSKSQLIPSALRGKPDDVLIVLLRGRDFGLSATEALAYVHVIDGRPSLSAVLLKALCDQSPLCEYFTQIKSSDASAIYETKRVSSPNPVRMEFTIAQAKTAGLMTKSNWQCHAAAMLRARAVSALARDVYPDVVTFPHKAAVDASVEFVDVETGEIVEPSD